MFARVLDTAKRILSRSPSLPGASSDAREVPSTIAPAADTAMVTTRGGIETPGAATPRGSARKQVGKRELEVLETPTQVKRQRKTASASTKKDAEHVPAAHPVQESSDDTSDTIAVAVPPSSSRKSVNAGATKKGSRNAHRQSSPSVVVSKLSSPVSTASGSFKQATQDKEPTSAHENTPNTPNLQSSSKNVTPKTKTTGASSTSKVKTAKTATPASAKKQGGRARKVPHTGDSHTLELTQTTTMMIDKVPSSSYESEQEPISSPEASKPTPQLKKAHKRFGSEEPADSVIVDIQSAKSAERFDDDDDSASDSDEAPEVVTAATATSKAQIAQAEAARASLAQRQKEAAKRQAREELIAAQQAAKREREEKKAKKLARKQETQATNAISEDGETTVAHRLDGMEAGLPALLPDSLLSKLPDQRAPSPPPIRHGKTEEEARREKLNHHIKFLERTGKPIKDLKKGKLSVAVLGQHNKVLPPKMNRNSSDVREHWLKGRRVHKKTASKAKFGGGKMERRRVGGGGFLRGED